MGLVSTITAMTNFCLYYIYISQIPEPTCFWTSQSQAGTLSNLYFPVRLPSPDGPQDLLGELKFISAGVTRYPIGRTEKQVDRRARQLPGTYRRPLARLDRLHHGTADGEVGRLEQRLQSFGELQTYVAGN